MMAESYQARLAELISRLDGEAQLKLRCAFVWQALNYAQALLHSEDEGDERACVRAVALWLEQPEAPESLRAIEAALEREGLAVMGLAPPHHLFWDVVRTTRVPLAQAAQLAVEVSAQVGGWLNPVAMRIDRQRGPRVAARAAKAAAARWQLSAAQAILRGGEPPPLTALPEPLDDPAQIFAAFRQGFDARDAYQRGDAHVLRLLVTVAQIDEFARLELAQVIRCARALLPPLDEDRGERACLGEPGGPPWPGDPAVEHLFRQIAAREAPERRPSLRDAYAALITAHVRRRQSVLATALAATAPWPLERSDPGPLSGWRAEYQSAQLQRLCARLDADGVRQLKPALVQQAIWYATGVLPDADASRDLRLLLEAVQRWLAGLDPEPPVDGLGPVPAGTPLARALVWNAVRCVAQAATAADAATLLHAVERAVVCAVAAQNGTSATGAEAVAAAYLACDYQLAVVARLRAAEAPPPWSGPEVIYSQGSFDAVIRQMNAGQQGRLRLALLRDGCAWARRGLEARLEPSPRLPIDLQLVAAIEAWAARDDAVVRGAVPELDAAVRAAAAAARQSGTNGATELSIALGLATQPAPSQAQTLLATRQVAKYCERVAFFAALALAERWELDATYAILCNAEPPQLALPLEA